jgi:hypothetical protein
MQKMELRIRVCESRYTDEPNEISLDFNRFNPLDNMDVGHNRTKINMRGM